MNKKYLSLLLLTIGWSILFTSCYKRELEVNIDNLNVHTTKSLKNNEYLRFKTFRVKDYDNYIIFGNNNEVSVSANASLPIFLTVNGVNTSAKLNLLGAVYEYDSTAESIVFRGALLECSQFSKPLVVDFLFKMVRIATTTTNGLDQFDFKLKSISVNKDKVLYPGDVYNVDGKSISFLSEFKFTLIYYKN